MAEHDVDLIGISAQQVFHGLGSAVGQVVAGQLGQNFHASLGAGLLIAFHTHVGGVVAFLTVDDNGLGVGTGLLDGPLAALISSVHVGGAHERGLASDANVGVNSQHGDASVDGSLQSALSGTSIVGSADDGVAASADLLLDHGNLTLDIALSAGADHNHVNTQIITGGLAASLHIAPVLRGQGLQDNSDLDIAGSGGLGLGLGLVLGVGRGLGLLAAAGSQRQSHYQCERQCKQLLHSSFAPFHFFQDVSGKKPNS